MANRVGNNAGLVGLSIQPLRLIAWTRMLMIVIDPIHVAAMMKK